ncbi:CHAT domain-containing protein [Methylobacterium oryzihabitans]|uniref:CHAT domain-containing protein n=1 Tax=Methylobacterium oryzihabitans TaxID=2499852 RepID=UPI0016520A33|nr:CHAT domain-containing protein [Methylobacterium oryzihabitans]
MAERGLRARAMKASGAPISAWRPLLDECGRVFDRRLARAREDLALGTPEGLNAAIARCDDLVAATAFLGADAIEGQALARNVRATALFHQGRSRDALRECERMLALLPSSPETASLWSGLSVNAASIACELDEDAAATAFIAVGLASIHGLGDDPDRIWDVLRIAADLDVRHGHFLDARRKIVTAVAVFEALGIIRSRNLARARARLATLEREFGRSDLAAELGRSALAAWPREDGAADYTVEAAHLWTEWAHARNWIEARPRLRRLARLAVADSSSRADFLIGLGIVTLDRGRFPTADRLLGRLVAWLDATAPGAVVARIEARRHHAQALIGRGRFEQASLRISEAAALVAASGEGTAIYRHVLARERGLLAERQGDPDGAVAWYLRAIVDEAWHVTAGSAGTESSLSEAIGGRDAIDAVSGLLRLVATTPTPERVRHAHEAVLASRGRATNAVGTRRIFHSEEARTIDEVRSELSRVVEWGGRLQAAGHPPADLADLALALAALDGQAVLAAPRLGEKAALTPGPRPPSRTLKAGDAAIDFVVAIERGVIEEGRLGRDVRLYAFVTTVEMPHPALVAWPNVAGQFRDLDALRRAMAEAEPEPELARRLNDLSRALWWPLAAHLPAGTRRLFLRADGNLAHLPFPALPDRDGTPLCERYEIVLVGPDLATAAPDRPPRDFLVVGDPAPAVSWRDRIAAMAREDESRVLPTGRLHGSRREAAAVAQFLRDRGRMDGTFLVGKHAARQAIIEALPARFVHLAMHGFAVPRGVRGSRPREDAVVGHPAPDWRAGLVCAGAEAWLTRNGPLQGDDDGLLLARDVAALPLAGTELVVLAACDTSAGEPVPGEGILALADAFLAAGARTVVASAWAIDDHETTRFMREFYAAHLDGAAAPTALRAVQSAWSRAQRNPRFWAGFCVYVHGET